MAKRISKSVLSPRIEYYTAKRIDNPYPPGELPWQVYHTVRNAVVRCCRKFGPTGPMGECPITEAPEQPWEPWDEWGPADDPCEYYVIDDQYNDERYIYIQMYHASFFNEAWLRALMATLEEFPKWGVGLMAFNRAYVLVFADKLLVTGRSFRQCTDIACVVRQGQANMARLERKRAKESERVERE